MYPSASNTTGDPSMLVVPLSGCMGTVRFSSSLVCVLYSKWCTEFSNPTSSELSLL
ncbi:hypothetical protein C0J52_18293 [Blattella germanica]|nr:hypothetical protein C0J52_18293 [Blattella germanica]